MTYIVSKLWEIANPTFWTNYARAVQESSMPQPRPGVLGPASSTFSWKPGSERVPDCVWPGGTDLTLRKDLAEEMARAFKNLSVYPITTIGAPRLKGRRAKPWTPVEFAGIWPTHWTAYDEELTKTEMRVKFAGIPLKHVIGAGSIDIDFKSFADKNIPIETPRIPGQGMFIHERDADGHDLFHIKQFPGMLIATDRFKNFVFEKRMTNIVLVEVGDLIA